MNKRKLLSLALTLCMVAILAIGGSLAYLTDTDAKTNVFTIGNVTIDLWENFNEEEAKLIPTTGKDADGSIKNAIEKEVYVTNTGSEDAYVRVHIAIPKDLDDGDPSFDAGKNVLHFNYAEASVGEGKWDWSDTTGAPYEGNYNFYTTQIDDIWYNVYVVTYESKLASGDETVDAIHQVYLDATTTNEDLTKIAKTLSNNWKIHVIAEGAQADGFDNAYDALNAAFGIPGKYTVNWNADTTGSVDKGTPEPAATEAPADTNA